MKFEIIRWTLILIVLTMLGVTLDMLVYVITHINS